MAFDPVQFQAVITQIQANNITSVVLHGDIDDAQGVTLANALADNTSVLSVDVSYSQCTNFCIQGNGALAFARMLQINNTLKKLNLLGSALSNNPATAYPVEFFAFINALQYANALEELSLSFNAGNFVETMFIAHTEAAKRMRNLKKIQVDYNVMQSLDTVNALAELIETSTSLTSIVFVNPNRSFQPLINEGGITFPVFSGNIATATARAAANRVLTALSNNLQVLEFNAGDTRDVGGISFSNIATEFLSRNAGGLRIINIYAALPQGEIRMLNTSNLQVIGNNTTPIRYDVIGQPLNVQVFNNQTRQVAASFRQADVDAGRIFIIDSGNYGDIRELQLRATNGTMATPVLSMAISSPTAAAAPRIVKSSFTVPAGNSVVLTSNDIAASFNGSTALPPGLTFIVNNVTGGFFRRKPTNEIIGGFYQADVLNGNIEFVSTGGFVSGTIQVNDGIRVSSAVALSVVPLTTTTTATSISTSTSIATPVPTVPTTSSSSTTPFMTSSTTMAFTTQPSTLLTTTPTTTAAPSSSSSSSAPTTTTVMVPVPECACSDEKIIRLGMGGGAIIVAITAIVGLFTGLWWSRRNKHSGRVLLRRDQAEEAGAIQLGHVPNPGYVGDSAFGQEGDAALAAAALALPRERDNPLYDGQALYEQVQSLSSRLSTLENRRQQQGSYISLRPAEPRASDGSLADQFQPVAPAPQPGANDSMRIERLDQPLLQQQNPQASPQLQTPAPQQVRGNRPPLPLPPQAALQRSSPQPHESGNNGDYAVPTEDGEPEHTRRLIEEGYVGQVGGSSAT